MGALLSPNALAISPSDWADPAKQDVFLDRLWGYFPIIDVLEPTKVFWSLDLATALFTNSTPPWLIDNSCKNPLVAALYPFIEKHTTEVASGECSCAVSPAGSCTSCSPNINSAFLKLVHTLALMSETPTLLGSVNDMPGNQSNAQFVCSFHGINVTERFCRDRSAYAATLDLPKLCWPVHPDCRNQERLQLGVQLTAEVKLKWPTGRELPAFAFGQRCLDNLARQTTHKDKILEALAVRLTVGLAEATKHPMLHDEDIPDTKLGRKGERRFRATNKLRFHYLPLSNGSVLFVRFFGSGEHDDGLR